MASSQKLWFPGKVEAKVITGDATWVSWATTTASHTAKGPGGFTVWPGGISWICQARKPGHVRREVADGDVSWDDLGSFSRRSDRAQIAYEPVYRSLTFVVIMATLYSSLRELLRLEEAIREHVDSRRRRPRHSPTGGVTSEDFDTWLRGSGEWEVWWWGGSLPWEGPSGSA